MTHQQIIAIAAWAAAGAAALAALAEWLHARRCRRLGCLPFGPAARPRAWAQTAPPLRVLALAGAVWALVTLLAFDGSSRMREFNASATRHLMVLLDVSPSMFLQDAGESGAETRRARAAEVLKSVMERANSDQVKLTMACFYTDAKLLVKECADRELIWHFADNQALHIAYRPGKTDLIKSLNSAGKIVQDFPRKSTTVLVLTDGDAVPNTGLQPMPSSVAGIIVAGVGDPTRGTFVDGHLSRQESVTLSQLARRLGGRYHEGNAKQVPSTLLRSLTAAEDRVDRLQVSLRLLAIITLASSVALLCLLPLLLEYLGSGWKPVPAPARAEPATTHTGKVEVAV
jgi:Ca-activated chloride channel homolog